MKKITKDLVFSYYYLVFGRPNGKDKKLYFGTKNPKLFFWKQNKRKKITCSRQILGPERLSQEMTLVFLGL